MLACGCRAMASLARARRIYPGLWVAIGILSALSGRQQTGKGCLIDFSMLDGQVSLLTLAIGYPLAYVLARSTSRCSSAAPR